MHTHHNEIEELQKEIKTLEKTELKIGINYKFSRLHGNKDCVKVINYDNLHVKIQDVNGFNFVPLSKFTTQYFKKGV